MGRPKSGVASTNKNPIYFEGEELERVKRETINWKENDDFLQKIYNLVRHHGFETEAELQHCLYIPKNVWVKLKRIPGSQILATIQRAKGDIIRAAVENVQRIAADTKNKNSFAASKFIIERNDRRTGANRIQVDFNPSVLTQADDSVLDEALERALDAEFSEKNDDADQ